MGKMSRTRKAMQEAGHKVGPIKGKVETMKCEDSRCPKTYKSGETKPQDGD